MRIGIVGHAQEKFTPETEAKARAIIREILTSGGVLSSVFETVLVSGHSPMGGVDIYAEEEAIALGFTPDQMDIKTPKTNSWDGEYGFKARNLDIASCSDIVHVICVKEYPPGYTGRRFSYCYHCAKIKGNDPKGHLKGGGCWTAMQALKKGKKAEWHII